MKSYKQIFFAILFAALLLIPNNALAQAADLPDFFMRIPIRPADNSAYSEDLFAEKPTAEMTYYIGGQPQTGKLAAIITNGRTMLPLRLAGEACGASVQWDDNLQQTTIILNKRKAVIKPNSLIMSVNDRQIGLDAAPVMHDNTLYVPLRSLGEALGKKVLWQSKLGQGFVAVCDREQEFSGRVQFNDLLSQTYLKQMLAQNDCRLLDVGQSALISVDEANNYYRNYAAVNEAIAWQDFAGAFPAETAAMGKQLGCTFRYYDPPAPGTETLAAFYNNGDVRIIYDVPPFYSFDAFIYGNYVYITEYHNDTARFLRVDLTTSPNEYFAPEEIKESDLPASHP